MSEAENQPTPPPNDPTQTATMAAFRPQAVVEPEEIWHIHVEVVGGPMDGHSNRRPGPEFTIGRGQDNDLSLATDPMVSSRHARIVRERQHYWLEDTGSRNGVFLGDQQLRGRVLIGPGTTFTVGQTQIEFMPR